MCRLIKQRQIKLDHSTIEKEKVLIVDDDYIIRNSMKNMINYILKKNSLDFDVLEAEDGSEMIDLVMNDIDNSIKIIFTDENMNFIEGSEAISKIISIKSTNEIKIISVTSLSDEVSISRILTCGADMVLPKPANKTLLEEVITNILKT